MDVILVVFLLGSLCHCGLVEAEYDTGIENLKQAALLWNGPVTCDKWDCNCSFYHQRGCCCAANDMFQLEDDTFMRMIYLWHSLSALKDRVYELTGGVKVAFKATMDPDITNSGSEQCFGPFNTNVPIPYSIVTLNEGSAYNPALGTFTAPVAGVYVFSFTVYSYVSKDGRLYHKVLLMRNGKVIACIWENNREDYEDSGNHVVALELQKGDQVYTELMSGRKLCKYMQFNIFTGYILYAHPHSYTDMYHH